jgi:hypothetical protein
VVVLTLGLVAGAGTVAIPQAAGQVFVEDTFLSYREALFSDLASQISALPNPTGGGFTYTFDPALGVFTRSTESFGPVFANRAETTGRGKFTINASFSHHTFDEIDGVVLRDGSFQPILVRPFVLQGQPFIVGDLLRVQTEARADAFSVGLLYGVTDRIDVGIIIPILDVKVRERVREDVVIVCPINDISPTGCQEPFIPGAFRANEATATGLGDIVLRGKWNFLQVPQLMKGRMGLALALDVKLPTGDDGDRDSFVTPALPDPLQEPATQRFGIGDPPLGTGAVRFRPQLVASGSWGSFAPHINVGADITTSDDFTNDLVYEVGFDYTFFQRATLSADLLGRHAFDVDRNRVTKQGVLAQDFGKKANPDTLTLSAGLKVNPIGTLLVFVNFLIPLNETGLRDNLTPTFGLEWSF